MPRSVGDYSSGVIPAGGGTQQAFIDTIVAQLIAFQSNGEQAWELADLIASGANYEAVFHSVGDRSLGSGSNKGDTDIWVYLHKRTTDDYECRVAQDYSPTTGNWSGGAHQPAGTGNFQSNIDDNAAVEWWCVVNEYEFIFIWLIGGEYGLFQFGQIIRPYSAALNGVARLTSQSGTGNGVVIGVDRDISANLKVGQYIWLVNQTPDATGIQAVSNDAVEVTAVGPSSITVDGVTNTYAVGSLVGLDPAPVYYGGAATGNRYMTSAANGAYLGGTDNTASLMNPGTAAITEGDYDPGYDQLYVGFQPYLSMATAPKGMRGKFQHIRVFSLGLQADQDLMQVDFDSAQEWKTFVTSGATMFTAWATGIGPGAT
jgi:hypothetical protein